MSRDIKILVCLYVVGLLITFTVARRARAQEKPARETRTWRAYELPSGAAAAAAYIDVIDTEGVCLYVARGRYGEYGVTPVAITAVPKTQLPKGAGCQ